MLFGRVETPKGIETGSFLYVIVSSSVFGRVETPKGIETFILLSVKFFSHGLEE